MFTCYFCFVFSAFSAYSVPSPPPSNIVISRKTSDALSMTYTLQGSQEVGVLYRQNNSQKSYSFLQKGISDTRTLDIQTLMSGTEYEIKVATLDRITRFPGIFRTITSRTFGKNRPGLRLQGENFAIDCYCQA